MKLYVPLALLEGLIVYLIAIFVCDRLDVSIPRLGSPQSFIILAIWPLIAPVLRPGLHSIPILGDLLRLIVSIGAPSADQQEKEGDSKE